MHPKTFFGAAVGGTVVAGVPQSRDHQDRKYSKHLSGHWVSPPTELKKSGWGRAGLNTRNGSSFPAQLN
jgi:hypothetical protein